MDIYRSHDLCESFKIGRSQAIRLPTEFRVKSNEVYLKRVPGGFVVLDREELLPGGYALTECPVSTSDGIKAVDVAWVGSHRARELTEAICLTEAPEICTEVLSPANSPVEMREKIALYFEAGAGEVWICDLNGRMSFQAPSGFLERSGLCPDFPSTIPTPRNG